MGCLPHMTRLALGRSPYEPLQPQEHGEGSNGSSTNFADCVQEFNEKGYPVNKISDLRASKLRIAMNDVLASVGVCYYARSGPDHHQVIKHFLAADDSARIEAVNVENEAGVTIATAEAGLSVFAGLCFLGLRQRVQAFRFYSGVPMLEIIREEWRHSGPRHFMLASMPATFITLILHLSTAFRQRKTWDLKYKHNVQLVMDIADKLLQVATFTLITELEVFAVLQRLGLLPSWPPSPSLISLIPFSASSPIQLLPSFFSPGGGPRAFHSLMFSPLLLFWVILHGKSQLNRWLYEYIRLALPRPINPDNYSVRGALRFEGTDVLIPEFESDPHEEFCGERLLAGLRRDISASVEKIRTFLRTLTDFRQKEDLGNERPSNSQDALVAPSQNLDATADPELEGFIISEEPLMASQNGVAVPEEPTDERATFTSSEEPSVVLQQNIDAIPIPQPQTSSTEAAVFAIEPQTVPIFDEGEPSLLDSVTPRFDDGEAGLPHNGYPSSTPPADNQDLNHHQSFEIPNLRTQDSPLQTLSRPLARQSPEAPPPDVISPEGLGTEVLAPDSDLTIGHPESVRETKTENPATTSTPHHRITTLSLHLAEALGTHLSAHLANILFLPIEALFVRTVALNFLSSPVFLSSSFSPRNAAIAASLAGEVYPRWTWFGDGMMSGWTGVTGYMARTTICQALEMAVGYSIWQIGAAVVWRLRPTYIVT